MADPIELLQVVMTATGYLLGMLLITDGIPEFPDPAARETSIKGEAHR